MTAEIKCEFNHILNALSGDDKLKAGYAFAFMKILSKYPLFIRDGICPDEDSNSKYMIIMNDCELWLNRKINPNIEEKLDLIIVQLSELSGFSKIRFKKLLSGFIRSNKSQIMIFSDLRKLYKFIKKCSNRGIADSQVQMIIRDANIDEFDKYMLNLLAAGPAAVSAINFNGVKMAGFKAEKYYYLSISDPKFDIVRFLLNGPHTILYAHGGCEVVELVCEQVDGSKNLVSIIYWLSDKEFDCVFKIHGVRHDYDYLHDIYPDGATRLEYLTIPY
jgi:hypothetical protein